MIPTESDLNVLSALRKAGIKRTLVLNINKGQNPEDLVESWENLCEMIIIRKNVGRDLAAYRDAWQILDKRGFEDIYLFNNSVFWLSSKMEKFLVNLKAHQGPLIGATNSFQPTLHLQSFSLRIKNQAFPIFSQAISKIRNTRWKQTAVSLGELKLSRDLESKSPKLLSALFDYQQLIRDLPKLNMSIESESFLRQQIRITRIQNVLTLSTRKQPLNPTHHFWFELYNSGFPGIKMDLLLKNPSAVQDNFLIETMLDDEDRKSLEKLNRTFLFVDNSIKGKIRRLIRI